MRRDEADEIVTAMKHHRNDAPGLALANSEYERATSGARNEVTLGTAGALRHFLSDINYFGVTKANLERSGVMHESGDMVMLNVGQLWEAAHQAPAKPAKNR